MVFQASEEISIKLAQQLVTNWSQSTASRKISQCRDALGKKDYQILTVIEFCEYYDIKILTSKN
jgi:hypothetical protein